MSHKIFLPNVKLPIIELPHIKWLLIPFAVIFSLSFLVEFDDLYFESIYQNQKELILKIDDSEEQKSLHSIMLKRDLLKNHWLTGIFTRKKL